MLQYYEPGEEVEVTLQVLGNGGYEEKKVTVTLDEEPLRSRQSLIQQHRSRHRKKYPG